MCVLPRASVLSETVEMQFLFIKLINFILLSESQIVFHKHAAVFKIQRQYRKCSKGEIQLNRHKYRRAKQ